MSTWSSRPYPIRTTALLIFLFLCLSWQAVAQPEKPESASTTDLVIQLTKTLEKHLAPIEKRTREASARCCALKSRSRFMVGNNGVTLPPGPSLERVNILKRETSILNQIEIWMRRALTCAIDRQILYKDTIEKVEETIAERRKKKRADRGPLAMADRLLKALIEFEARLRDRSKKAQASSDLRKRELEAFLLRQKQAENTLLQAEQAWQAEEDRLRLSLEAKKAALLEERKKLGSRYKQLEEEQKLINTEENTRLKLLHSLQYQRLENQEKENNPPLEDLIQNALDRASLRTIKGIQEDLRHLKDWKLKHLNTLAALHEDWHNYLKACAGIGILLPKVPGLDPKENLLARTRVLQEMQRTLEEKATLTRGSKLTMESQHLLTMDAEALMKKYLQHEDMGGLFERLAPMRRISPRRVPPTGSTEMHRIDRKARAALNQVSAQRSKIIHLRREGRDQIQIVGKLCTMLAELRNDNPDFARQKRAVLEARARAIFLADAYQSIRDETRTKTLELEAYLAKLQILIDGFQSVDRNATSWKLENVWIPEFRRRARQLPPPETLICIMALILLIGTFVGRLRRPRWLGQGVRLFCFMALLVFLLSGLLLEGPAASILAAGGGLSLILLLGFTPVNLYAGVRLRLTGQHEPGQMIWNDVVKGRILQRGLLSSILSMKESSRMEVKKVENRLLLRSASSTPDTDEASHTSTLLDPDQVELHVLITLNSDWIAVRQLVKRIGHSHDKNSDVLFQLKNGEICLTLKLSGKVDVTSVREDLLRALRAAPFARLVDS